MTGNHQIPWYGWILLSVVLITQGMWLFLDARRRDASPWLWGILGLIQFPMPLLIYLLIVRKIFQRNRREVEEEQK